MLVVAKGGAVGFWMEGSVKNVTVSSDRIKCELSGQFWFVQYPEGQTGKSIIYVDLNENASILLTQANPFFAMSTDWREAPFEKGSASSNT